MNIQAYLNDQSIKALGKDFNDFIAAQESHYQNQIEYKALQHLCNCSNGWGLAFDYLNTVDKEIFIEIICRQSDADFRHDSDYITYSEFHHKSSDADFDGDFDGDLNTGYIYTTAKYNTSHYEFEINH
jgi:hypothetical protein